LSAVQHADLGKVITLYTEVWEFYKNTGLRITKWFVPANRGVTFRMLGEETKAREAFRLSIEVKANFFAYRHLIVLQHDQGQDNLALIAEMKQDLELNEEEKEELFFFELGEMMQLKRYPEMITLIQQAPALKNPEATFKLRYFEARVMLATGRKDQAIQSMVQLADIESENPEPNYLAAELAWDAGKKETAREYFKRTVQRMPNDPDSSFVSAVSELGVQLEEHTLVASLLNKDIYRQHLSPLNYTLLQCLMLSGQREEAQAIAEPLFDSSNPNPMVASIVLNKYEYNGKVQEALLLAKDMSERLPQDIYYAAKVLTMLIKNNQESDAEQHLDKLLIKFNVKKVFEILQSMGSFGGDRCLLAAREWALKIRNSRLGDENVHKGYIRMTHGLRDQGHGEDGLSLVSSGCGVTIQRIGIDSVVTIDDSGTILNAVSPNSKSGRILMGRRPEDYVELDGRLYIIKNICSKFHAAYWDSTYRLSER